MIWLLLFILVWLAMAYFSVRSVLLIDKHGKVPNDIYWIILLSILIAPIAFFVSMFDGYTDRREVFFMGPRPEQTKAKKMKKQKNRQAVGEFFGVKKGKQ